MKDILEKISNYSLEEIMGERFGRYSKYIIQDRAIPDVRDGLKPVQRRILYAMYIGHNTCDKPYRKSAKTVGDVIGSFHPHGDSSIYDAMVRLSQDWKMKNPLIDMHGNNGSIDGDSPAAYRYTEARLSKIANELIKEIDKDTVAFAPNFDDSILEPTVLPAKFPNLIVNGTTGISAGYATNIPPHNLGEVIDATIKRIDSPNCTIDTILNIIKGPDFPTGGIALNENDIRTALTTGKGKVVVRSKVEIKEEKNKNIIIVNEIPFDVLKTNIVKKIDEIRIEHKIEGIIEVRDESDKEGLRIVIELKKEANQDLILNYLYKNTELQSAYNYNMVAIVNRRPKLLSITEILDAYIAHYKEIITKRTEFDLAHASKRFHIVEGLIKAISILDQVIATIRKSKNKQDAKENLVKEYNFTIEQAEAIVVLQLYRLTNTDITLLEEELKNLQETIANLKLILSDEKELHKVMKNELRDIKHEYDIPRKTTIENLETEIKIDTELMIPKEEVVTLVTHDGYIKRISKRAYQSNTEEPLLKDQDYVIGLFKQNTTDTLLLFTNLGNYLYLPVYEIPEIKWRMLGKHISNIIKISESEYIVKAIPINDFNTDKDILIASKLGMIKKTSIKEFKVNRYSKPISCMKLKEKDEVVNAFVSNYPDIFIATNKCYSLWFDEEEVPLSGIKSSGVKSINLKDDYVVSIDNFNKELEYITIFTDKKTAKRVKLTEFEKQSRAKRGLLILRDVKTNPYKIIKALPTNKDDFFGIKTNDDITYLKNTEIAISDRYKTGMTISKKAICDVFLKQELEELDLTLDNKENISKEEKLEKEEITDKIDIKESNTITKEQKLKKEKEVEIKEEIPKKEKPHQISLLEIDDELKRIDDILN